MWITSGTDAEVTRYQHLYSARRARMIAAVDKESEEDHAKLHGKHERPSQRLSD
jgi:hypothetical protein